MHEPRGKRVIKASVASQIRTMLEGVLAPGGTASEVSIPGYTLAGKTGTAEVAENGTYSNTKYVASFIGFAPAQDPKLLVAVIVDQPQGDIYGGSVAAPGLRADRQLRAAVSGDRTSVARPAVLSWDGTHHTMPERPSGASLESAAHGAS